MEVVNKTEETYFLSISGIPAGPSQLINQWELGAPGSWHSVNSILYAQRPQLLPRTEPCVRRTWGICIKVCILESACLHFAVTVHVISLITWAVYL